MKVARSPTLATTSTTHPLACPTSPRQQRHENAKASLNVIIAEISTNFHNIFIRESESVAVFEVMMAKLESWEFSPVIENRTSTRKSAEVFERPRHHYRLSLGLDNAPRPEARQSLIEPSLSVQKKLRRRTALL